MVVNMCSSIPKKESSIFPPNVYRYSFGKSVTIVNHKLYAFFAFATTEGFAGGG